MQLLNNIFIQLPLTYPETIDIFHSERYNSHGQRLFIPSIILLQNKHYFTTRSKGALLLVLHTAQMLLRKGGNYGRCAVIFGLFAVQKVIIAAAFYAIAFVMVLVFYIVSLFRSVT